MICAASSNAIAGDNVENYLLNKKAGEGSLISISPIYSQLLMFSSPSGFRVDFEQTSPMGNYIRESVLKGETVHKWTQMITVTGAKGLASNPKLSPLILVSSIASGFKRVCPETFSMVSIGPGQISGFDAFTAVTSCGNVRNKGNNYSETALIIAVKGENDYYTIQWAERGAASAKPIDFEEKKWKNRFYKLRPIKLCPIIAGEAAPYLSCVDKK